MSKRKKAPLIKSFSYAFQGFFSCVRKERNMKMHCCSAVLVVFFGLLFNISFLEWCICLILIGMVMALEMVNTAIEAAVDLISDKKTSLGKLAKDAAAGAVLVVAIMAAVTGFIIFLPKGIMFLKMFYRDPAWLLRFLV